MINDMRVVSPYGKEPTDEEIVQLVSYIRTEMNSYPSDETLTVEKVSTLESITTRVQSVVRKN